MPNGKRKLVSIAEIGEEAGHIQDDIFRYEQQGVAEDGTVQGRFVATDLVREFHQIKLSASHCRKRCSGRRFSRDCGVD